MEAKDFTYHPEVVHLLSRMKNDQVDQKHFSDLVDSSGRQ